MSSNLPVQRVQLVPEVQPDHPGPLEIPVSPGLPAQWAQLGPLDPLGPPVRLEIAVQLALRAIEVIRGLPALPDRAELMASLDLLGRSVLLVSKVLRAREGPLGRLAILEPRGFKALLDSLVPRDLAERLDLLEILVRLDQQDLPVLLALVLLVQRGLLELDPPG